MLKQSAQLCWVEGNIWQHSALWDLRWTVAFLELLMPEQGLVCSSAMALVTGQPCQYCIFVKAVELCYLALMVMV